MRTLIRWTIAMTAGLVLAHAAASQPVNGTEAVVTDAAGHQLVGYGVVTDGLLMLRMGVTPESFVLLLVAPDGTIQRFDGVRGAGGALLVDLPDGTRETLTSYLGRDNVAMRIVRGKSDTTVAGATHESGSAGTPSSSDSGASGGSSDSSSSSSTSASGSSGDTSISVDTGDSSSSDSSGSGDSTDGP